MSSHVSTVCKCSIHSVFLLVVVGRDRRTQPKPSFSISLMAKTGGLEDGDGSCPGDMLDFEVMLSLVVLTWSNFVPTNVSLLAKLTVI